MQDVPVQVLKPHRLRKWMEETRITLSSLSAFTYEIPDGGISITGLSQFTNEARPTLTLNAQLSVYLVMEFARTQAALANGVPVDFNALPEMRKRFREFLRKRKEVVKTEAEEVAEAAGAKA